MKKLTLIAALALLGACGKPVDTTSGKRKAGFNYGPQNTQATLKVKINNDLVADVAHQSTTTVWKIHTSIPEAEITGIDASSADDGDAIYVRNDSKQYIHLDDNDTRSKYGNQIDTPGGSGIRLPPGFGVWLMLDSQIAGNGIIDAGSGSGSGSAPAGWSPHRWVVAGQPSVGVPSDAPIDSPPPDAPPDAAPVG